MLLLIAACCFTLLLAYIIYVLMSSYGSDFADNSLDAFIDTSPSTGTDVSSKALNYSHYSNIITVRE